MAVFRYLPAVFTHVGMFTLLQDVYTLTQIETDVRSMKNNLDGSIIISAGITGVR